LVAPGTAAGGLSHSTGASASSGRLSPLLAGGREGGGGVEWSAALMNDEWGCSFSHSDVEEGEEGRKGEALTEKSTARSDKGEAHDTRPGRRRHVCGRAESGHQAAGGSAAIRSSRHHNY